MVGANLCFAMRAASSIPNRFEWPDSIDERKIGPIGSKANESEREGEREASVLLHA